jgi:cytochrome c oxidase assembly factor CtaG
MVRRVRTLPYRWRIAVILAAAIAALGIVAMVPPIAQDPAYHDFADQRALWRIPNFDDVVANVLFLLVGGLGFVVLFGRSEKG